MPLLEVKNSTKYFKGLRAVHDVTFSIEENEIFGMIGPNGSGKTTIFNMLNGIYAPTDGDVLFQNQSVVGLHPHLVCRRGMGRTFQIAKPFLKLTVLENVIIGALNRTASVSEAEKKAEEVLSRLGLMEKMDAQGEDLTVPERKRLELARALATEPKLLLLDEVMAGLNPVEVKELLVILRNIASEGVSLFIIEHIMHAIMSISQKIMVLHHGELIAIGSPKEVGNDAKVIEAYLGEEYSVA